MSATKAARACAALDAVSATIAQQALTRLVERIIEQLDAADGDADMEPDADDEDGGDGDPSVHPRDYYPGDPGDAEEGGDMEPEPGELDSCDYEPSRNAPVSETLLGHAAWRPGPMPASPAVYEPVPVIPAVRVPRAAPDGYVAVRVLKPGHWR